MKELKETLKNEFAPEGKEGPYTVEQVKKAFEVLEERVVRDLLIDGKRIDGRNVKQVRAIWCEVGTLPCAARLGRLPARRDAGIGNDRARHLQRRAARGRHPR